MSKKAKKTAGGAEIITLAEVRARLRLAAYQTKVANIVESNRQTIARLYSTGAMFSYHGARAGRDLLLAHQHLIRVVTLLNRLSHRGDVPGPRRTQQVDEVFHELDELLDRTHQITHRTGDYLARLKNE